MKYKKYHSGKPTNYCYTANDHTKFRDAITPAMIKLIRDRTEIGDDIHYLATTINMNGCKETEVYGTVTEKYTNVFRLSNGTCGTWIDYLLGNYTVKKNIRLEADKQEEHKFYYQIFESEENSRCYEKILI